MFIESLIIAVIIGLLMKGKISNLGRLDLKYVYLIFAAYLIQVGIAFGAPRWDFGGYPYLHIFSYLLLFFSLYRNRLIPGMRYIFGGTAMNFAVIAVNGGRMPVRADVIPEQMAALLATAKGGTHVLINETTKLAFLADIFYISLPYQNSLISIGDIVIDFGILVLVVRGMKGITGAK